MHVKSHNSHLKFGVVLQMGIFNQPVILISIEKMPKPLTHQTHNVPKKRSCSQSFFSFPKTLQNALNAFFGKCVFFSSKNTSYTEDLELFKKFHFQYFSLTLNVFFPRFLWDYYVPHTLFYVKSVFFVYPR